MRTRFYFRLARVILHLVQGLVVCALVFPWASTVRRNWHIRRWSRQLVSMCGVRVALHEASPALTHAMVVSNHISWLDIFVINSLLPCRFVAKSEIREWPVVGWLVAMAGTVFIARGNRRDLRHIFKGMVASLQLGERVAFFPEGTTAAQGTVLPFHANLFEAAIDARVPVQPYALRYVDAHGAFHPAVDYTGDTTFVQSMMRILGGTPVFAELTCLPHLSVEGAHRRDLSATASAAITAALTTCSTTPA
jgi:1-acyl-sn-glycerol-3-phosphate acyltransferase